MSNTNETANDAPQRHGGTKMNGKSIAFTGKRLHRRNYCGTCGKVRDEFERAQGSWGIHTSISATDKDHGWEVERHPFRIVESHPGILLNISFYRNGSGGSEEEHICGGCVKHAAQVLVNMVSERLGIKAQTEKEHTA